jgi:hypothetical protein
VERTQVSQSSQGKLKTMDLSLEHAGEAGVGGVDATVEGARGHEATDAHLIHRYRLCGFDVALTSPTFPGAVSLHPRDRSAEPLLEHREVPDRVPMVLPLLLEDHVQALQHGVVLARVAGAVGRDAVPLQFLGVHGGDHFAYLLHAPPARIEHLVQRRVGVRVDAPVSRAGEPPSSQAPRGGTGERLPSPSAAASSP